MTVIINLRIKNTFFLESTEFAYLSFHAVTEGYIIIKNKSRSI